MKIKINSKKSNIGVCIIIIFVLVIALFFLISGNINLKKENKLLNNENIILNKTLEIKEYDLRKCNLQNENLTNNLEQCQNNIISKFEDYLFFFENKWVLTFYYVSLLFILVVNFKPNLINIELRSPNKVVNTIIILVEICVFLITSYKLLNIFGWFL